MIKRYNYIWELINFFNSFSSNLPGLLSSNFPFLNKTKVGKAEISHFYIISSFSSPFTFKNLTLLISFDILANYKLY